MAKVSSCTEVALLRLHTFQPGIAADRTTRCGGSILSVDSTTHWYIDILTALGSLLEHDCVHESSCFFVTELKVEIAADFDVNSVRVVETDAPALKDASTPR